MKALYATLTVISILGVLSCSSHEVKQPKDPLALQEIQTRDFDVNMKVAFASVLSVLQDVGYIIEAADGESGLITAKSPTDSNTNFDVLFGFGKTNSTTRVTAFVEPVGQEYSKVRLNFVSIVGKSKLYGVNSQIDTPIEDPAVYDNIFERIEEAVFIRKSTQGI